MAVDPCARLILAEPLTESGSTDASQVEQIDAEAETFNGDGAYDAWALREYLQGERIHQVIPPRKNTKIKQHGNSSAAPLERDECVWQTRRDRKKAWKESIGYHRHCLGGTAMSRLRTNFGARLKNRSLPNHATEAALRGKRVNHFVRLGVTLFARG